jgi:hypothetical protein
MRQKVGYLESVNAELCEQLERCDAEAFSHQGGLQAEKAELAARMRQLQEEVSTLCLCMLNRVAYFAWLWLSNTERQQRMRSIWQVCLMTGCRIDNASNRPKLQYIFLHLGSKNCI